MGDRDDEHVISDDVIMGDSDDEHVISDDVMAVEARLGDGV